MWVRMPPTGQRTTDRTRRQALFRPTLVKESSMASFHVGPGRVRVTQEAGQERVLRRTSPHAMKCDRLKCAEPHPGVAVQIVAAEPHEQKQDHRKRNGSSQVIREV